MKAVVEESHERIAIFVKSIQTTQKNKPTNSPSRPMTSVELSPPTTCPTHSSKSQKFVVWKLERAAPLRSADVDSRCSM